MAYREAKEKCAECEDRRERLAEMVSFEDPGRRRCPACRSEHVGLAWGLCSGGKLLETPTGMWWWKKTPFRTCKVTTRHLHMRCRTCDHEWLMKSAYDAESDPVVKKLEEQTKQLIDLATKREAAAAKRSERG